MIFEHDHCRGEGVFVKHCYVRYAVTLARPKEPPTTNALLLPFRVTPIGFPSRLLPQPGDMLAPARKMTFAVLRPT